MGSAIFVFFRNGGRCDLNFIRCILTKILAIHKNEVFNRNTETSIPTFTGFLVQFGQDVMRNVHGKVARVKLLGFGRDERKSIKSWPFWVFRKAMTSSR